MENEVINQELEIPAENVEEKVEENIVETSETSETSEAPDTTEAPDVSEPSQPSTETMDDFKDEIEASLKRVAVGDLLTGTVIGVSETEVNLDLKYYAQAIITKENLSNDPNFNLKEEIKMGDEITGTVIKKDDGEGNIVLSRKEANDILAWEKLASMMAERAVIHSKISGVVNGGVIVSVEGIRGFIPASKLDIGYVEDLNEWLNKTVDCTIITVDKETNKLVLSAKEIALQKLAEEKNKKIAKCEVGTVMDGTVDGIKDYGAFINLENGLSGLLHVSQISNTRIKHPSAVLKEGQTVKVKIIAIKENKISLSMKALIEEVDNELNMEFKNYKGDSDRITTGLGSLLAGIKLDKS